jgi:acetoacetate decarboxylase
MSPHTPLPSFAGTHLDSASYPYPLPPYTLEVKESFFFDVRTTPEVLRALVPTPLVANPDDRLSIYVGRYEIIEPLSVSYLEAGIAIPVSYAGQQGAYMPVLFLDQALAITLGRELCGFPKLDAQIEFQQEGQTLHARVVRQGITLIEASFTLGTVQPVDPTASTASNFFLVKIVPSVRAQMPPDVWQLNRIPTQGITYESRAGEGTLHLGSTPLEPLAAIPMLEIVESGYSRGCSVFECGEVLYDYLAERAATTVSP